MLNIVYYIRQTNGEDPKTTKRKRNKMTNLDHIELESEEAIAEFITQALEEADSSMYGQRIRDIRSFEDAGVLSNDTGMVISTSSGQKFAITIVESTPSY